MKLERGIAMAIDIKIAGPLVSDSSVPSCFSDERRLATCPSEGRGNWEECDLAAQIAEHARTEHTRALSYYYY